MLVSLHTQYKKFTCSQGWYLANLGVVSMHPQYEKFTYAQGWYSAYLDGEQKGFFIQQFFKGSIIDQLCTTSD
jgi:hypothetical protein